MLRFLMELTVYLDQNILSELRERKLKVSKDKKLICLKNILQSSDIQVVYSNITIVEIKQITNAKYRDEHINLLEKLNAKYIEPRSKKLINKTPRQVLNEFKSKKNDFEILEKTNDLFAKKISGLPVNNTFQELNKGYYDSVELLLKDAVKQLNSINTDDKLVNLMKENLLSLLSNIQSTWKDFPNFDEKNLGPNYFREYKAIKELDILNLDITEVVTKIETIINQDNLEIPIIHSEESIDSKIAKAYSLMNWAGYYQDDFNKIKKNKDRFNSSMNDMKHAVMASKSNFLISNDKNFLMKVKACYSYSSVNTVANSLSDFLSFYTLSQKKRC